MADKKVLFISYDGLTDPLGQSQVIPYLAGLSKYGYQFTILSCDKPGPYKKNKAYVEKLLEPHSIKWVSLPYHKFPPVLSSMYDLNRIKKKATQLHRREKFDMLHTRPGIPTLAALWLKKKFGIKFLNDIRGFWADERVDGGMWNLKNPLYKKVYNFFKEHEYECIRSADANTCLTYKAKAEMQTWKQIPGQPIPIEVIPCSADLSLFDPAAIDPALKQKLKTELNINDKDIILSYLGSIGGWYLTNEMMAFSKTLLEKMPGIKFLFISPHRHNVIEAAANKYGISPERIIVRKGMRHEVPALLSLSDYSLFFIKPCYSKMSSSPTKHGEIMAMGIPVITNAGVGDVEEITTKYNAGVTLSSLDAAEYERAAAIIASGKKFNKEEIVAGAADYYSLDKAIQKYLKVYRQILGD
jgi:glycosyltransferase involved in cell wall biosynthesis